MVGTVEFEFGSGIGVRIVMMRWMVFAGVGVMLAVGDVGVSQQGAGARAAAPARPGWQVRGASNVRTPVYDTVQPTLPFVMDAPAILIFSKTNGFRDEKAMLASNMALLEMAEREGWSYFVTENAAVFNPEQLRQFQAVVWNNTSGDVLTQEQREAFKDYIEGGGGFVGIHGAGGDPQYAWRWYVERLIGAQFIGHPSGPQFQQATVRIEDTNDPATRLLGEEWQRVDEWYSFAASPREKVHVLATLDERTYSPMGGQRDLRMGKDHPIIWKHCVGKGRAFYSALGHSAGTYEEPLHLAMLRGAIAWAAGLEGEGCVVR
jgi:uncharacterized protein